MSGVPGDRVGEPDVDDELIEDAAGELGGDVETDRPEVAGVVERVGSPSGEGEEVVQSELLGGGEVLGGCVLVIGAAEIHVSGRPCGRVEAEVECEGALQDPAVGSHGDQAAEKELEGNASGGARCRARSLQPRS